jgi:hypothetical protein
VTQTYRKLRDDLPELSPEHKPMISTVDEKLDFVWQAVMASFDIHLQKGLGNQLSAADIVMEDGSILAKSVPATVLLTIENDLLPKLRALYHSIPTLTPGKEWKVDPNRIGVYTATPEERLRTEKTLVPVVLYDATEHHPAQVKESHKDEPTYRVVSTAATGAWSLRRKSEVIANIDKLLIAVKRARMVANDTPHPEEKIGQAILDFLHK